jgi:SAM-dependent methyltransferase
VDDSNSKTLNAYEAHVQEYIDGTPQEVGEHVKVWIDAALVKVPQDAKILELGSAFGRDAAYIEAAGFTVQRTDATKAFVDLLQDKGYTARVLNIITDDLDGPYDMVFANAVLLHLTAEEFQAAVAKIYASLREKGIFAFTVKQGTGTEWSDTKLGAPRFFQYWAEQPLRQVLEDNNFAVLELATDSAQKWLHVITQK